jgi:hypothetical protein
MLFEVLRRTGKFGIGALFAVLWVLFKADLFSGGATASVSSDHASIIEKFRMNAHETKAFNVCRSELSRHYLRSGGDMAYLCGCIAKNATENINDAYKAKAVNFFAAYVKQKSIPKNPRSYFPDASWAGQTGTVDQAWRSVLKEGNDCADVTVEKHKQRLGESTARRAGR